MKVKLTVRLLGQEYFLNEIHADVDSVANEHVKHVEVNIIPVDFVYKVLSKFLNRLFFELWLITINIRPAVIVRKNGVEDHSGLVGDAAAHILESC